MGINLNEVLINCRLIEVQFFNAKAQRAQRFIAIKRDKQVVIISTGNAVSIVFFVAYLCVLCVKN